MKFFVFMLSFYMLALNCFPCGDSQECNLKQEQEISVTTSHQDHTPNTETCTPFCSCSCCAASAFYQPVLYAKTIPLDFQSFKFHNKADFSSYDFHSVWQPPKIS
jgi:hypothetical protein